MTAAERMRRHRANKRRGIVLTPREKLYLAPIRVFAPRVLRISPRQYYYDQAVKRHALIKWDDILAGKHGKVGIEFLAEVCKHGDASAQRAVHNKIKKAGAAAGRALWQKLIHDNGQWDLIHKHTHRHNMRMMTRA